MWHVLCGYPCWCESGGVRVLATRLEAEKITCVKLCFMGRVRTDAGS